jgi:predicted MPP superfamily phosphohydrolase
MIAGIFHRRNDMKRIRWLWAVLSFLLVCLIGWTVWENCSPIVTLVTIENEQIPDSFSGFRIALISDLHNAQYGENNEQLLTMLRQEDPDMIALVGDFVDSRRTDFDVSLHFAEQALTIAPIYYVMGNHEARLTEEFPSFAQQLKDYGVTVLRNEEAYIRRNEQFIRIVGIDDPMTVTKKRSENEAVILHALSKFDWESTPYTILLSHRPEQFDAYCQYHVDLALTGHNHGGLFRLPGIGGLYAGEQLFPLYDAGLFEKEKTVMYLSRGAGNSSYTFRINNRPEIVILTLT